MYQFRQGKVQRYDKPNIVVPLRAGNEFVLLKVLCDFIQFPTVIVQYF